MPHKLQITAHVSQGETRISYLQPYELVRGEPVEIDIVVTNIGDVDFPGGPITRVEIKYNGGSSARASKLEEVIPPLQPSGDVALPSLIIVTPISEGPAFAEMEIQAADDEPISYYQNRDGMPLGAYWTAPLYVVSREQLSIISLLQTLAEGKE